MYKQRQQQTKNTTLPRKIILLPMDAITLETKQAIESARVDIDRVYTFAQQVNSISDELEKASYVDPSILIMDLDPRSEFVKVGEKIINASNDLKDVAKELETLTTTKHEASEQLPLIVYVISEDIEWLQNLIEACKDYKNFKIKAIPFDQTMSAIWYSCQIRHEDKNEVNFSLACAESQMRLQIIIEINTNLQKHLAYYLGKVFCQEMHGIVNDSFVETYSNAIQSYYTMGDNPLTPLVHIFSQQNQVWKQLSPLFEKLKTELQTITNYFILLNQNPGFILTAILINNYIVPLKQYLEEFKKALVDNNQTLVNLIETTIGQLQVYETQFNYESNDLELNEKNLQNYAEDVLKFPKLHQHDSKEVQEYAYKFLYAFLKSKINSLLSNYRSTHTKPIGHLTLSATQNELDDKKIKYNDKQKFEILGGALLKEYFLLLDQAGPNSERARYFSALLKILFKFNAELKTTFELAYNKHNRNKQKYFSSRLTSILDKLKEDMEDESETSDRDVGLILQQRNDFNDSISQQVPGEFKIFFGLKPAHSKPEEKYRSIIQYAQRVLKKPEHGKNKKGREEFVDLAYEYLFYELKRKLNEVHKFYQQGESKRLKDNALTQLMNALTNSDKTNLEKFQILLGGLIMARDQKQARHQRQAVNALAEVTVSDQVQAYDRLLIQYPKTVQEQSKKIYWYHHRGIKKLNYFGDKLSAIINNSEFVPVAFVQWPKLNKNLGSKDINDILYKYAIDLLTKPKSAKNDDPNLKELAHEYLVNAIKKQLINIHYLTKPTVPMGEGLSRFFRYVISKHYSFQEQFEILVGILLEENVLPPANFVGEGVRMVSNMFKKPNQEKIYDLIIQYLNISNVKLDTLKEAVYDGRYQQALLTFKRDLKQPYYYTSLLSDYLDQEMAPYINSQTQNITSPAVTVVDTTYVHSISTSLSNSPKKFDKGAQTVTSGSLSGDECSTDEKEEITNKSGDETDSIEGDLSPQPIVESAFSVSTPLIAPPKFQPVPPWPTLTRSRRGVSNLSSQLKLMSPPPALIPPPILEMPFTTITTTADLPTSNAVPAIKAGEVAVSSSSNSNGNSDTAAVEVKKQRLLELASMPREINHCMEFFVNYAKNIEAQEHENDPDWLKALVYDYKFNQLRNEIFASRDCYMKKYHQEPKDTDAMRLIIDLPRKDLSYKERYQILAGAILKECRENSQSAKSNRKPSFFILGIYSDKPESIMPNMYFGMQDNYIPETERDACESAYQAYQKALHSRQQNSLGNLLSGFRS